MPRRVVITGIGTVNGFGIGAQVLWDGLCGDRSAITPIKAFDPSGFPSRLAAQAPDVSAKDFVPKAYRKAVKVMARDIEMAVIAARQAVEDARLVTREAEGQSPTYPSARVSCHIGAGLIAAETEELTSALATSAPNGAFSLTLWGEGGINNLQPLWLLKYLPNMLACHVTILHGCEGPSNTITCGESSGLLSLGESLRVLQRADADAGFSGSAESKINLMGMHRIIGSGRLAHTGDSSNPLDFIKPYDPASQGSLMGEGGAILILEDHAAAASRGVTPYAEVLGFGAANSIAALDTFIISRDSTLDSTGLQWAIEGALADARINAADIDAIIPHAAGHPALDRAEAQALQSVFGDRLAEVPLVTLTPYLGECLAGRASLQAAVGALCLRRQMLPARLNAGTPASGLDAGAASARSARLNHILVCCSSIGGSHAALVLGAA